MENKSSRNRWKRLLLIFVIYRQVQLDPGGTHNQMLVPVDRSENSKKTLSTPM